MRSNLKSSFYFYEIFEVSLNEKFQDKITIFTEKKLLDLLDVEIFQRLGQSPREFWLSKASPQRNSHSSVQVRHCLVFFAEKLSDLWPNSPLREESLSFEIKIFQDELNDGEHSLETAFRIRFGEFRKWHKEESALKINENLVVLHKDEMHSIPGHNPSEGNPSGRKTIVQTTPKSSYGQKKQEQMVIENPEEKRSAEKVRNYFQQHVVLQSNTQSYAQESTENENQRRQKRHEEDEKMVEKENPLTPSKEFPLQPLQETPKSVVSFDAKSSRTQNRKSKFTSGKKKGKKSDSTKKSDTEPDSPHSS